jgi:hypothetical protein
LEAVKLFTLSFAAPVAFKNQLFSLLALPRFQRAQESLFLINHPAALKN